MIILALGCLLLGAVFGRLFKVWILLPTFALLFALACANRAILEFVVLSTCLQLGYVSGLRFCVICDLWRRRPPPGTLASSRAKRQRGTGILFDNTAPLTGPASTPSNPPFC